MVSSRWLIIYQSERNRADARPVAVQHRHSGNAGPESAMSAQRNWWKAGRPFSRAEVVADGVVHGIGILAALAAGSVLLASTLSRVTPAEAVAAAIYVGTLIAVLSVSLAFNMWPV